MFNTAYNLDFKQTEKGLIECDVTITKSFFKLVTSKEELTICFVGKFWVNKDTMETIRNTYLIEVVTNTCIYHSAKTEEKDK